MDKTQDISAALTELMAALDTGDNIRQQVALVAVVADVFTDIKRAANALETVSKFELVRVGELVYGATMTKEKDDATNAIASWILANVDGEPINNEGAIVTMARLLAEKKVTSFKTVNARPDLSDKAKLMAVNAALDAAPMGVTSLYCLTPEEWQVIEGMRAGTVYAGNYTPPPLTPAPSIVGIPDNAPFGPGPGGITPADKRFIPYSGVVPYSHEPYQPVMWHDGENVYGPVQSSAVPWTEHLPGLNFTVKAYFLVD